METKHTRIRLALGLGATAVFAFLISGAALAGGSCHQDQTSATTSVIDLTALCFSPTIAHVSPGETVEFVNRDGFAHNVVGHGTGWGQIEQLPSGATLSVAFEEAGIYPYTCTIHPGMVGAVVVGDIVDAAAGSATIPEEGGLSATAVGLMIAAPAALVLVWRWSHRVEDDA